MESTPSAQKRSHVPSRRLLYALGLAAIFIVSFLSSQGYLLQQFELKSIDWRFHVRGERTPTDDVALVLIDERSLGELGQWPWPRSTHARLIEALNHGGARVIVFDVLFAEKSDPAEDAALVAAVKQAGNVVLGAFAPGEGMLVEQAHTELLAGFALRPREVANRGRAASVATLRGPLDPLMRAVAGIGLAMAPPDRDGVLRHAFLAVHNDADGLLYPTLGLAGGKAALSLPDDDISIDFSRRMRLGDAAIVSLDTRGRAMINFTGGRGTREHISYVDVLEGRLEQGAVHNKIVLVGIGAHGLYDVHPNPFSPDFLGPEFNADFIDNVLSDNFLTSASPGVNMLLLVLIGLIVTYLSANLRSITAAGVSAVTIVVFIAAVTWAFTSADMVIGMIAPTTTALLAYTLITLRRLTSEEVSRARLRKYFASYAPPEVVEELDAGIMQEKMAGTQSEITVLFSDIRGFTSIGSTMEPPRLVRFLNLYFTAMVGVVFDYGGTVDKFIGDGLLVLYNALTEQPDHAKRAVFTALEMQKRVKLLNEEWADDGFPAIRIGVGIHTGDAVVGNIGPEMRMDYTAIGSTVSLASRTEGLTKDFGVEVIITDHTLAQLDDLVEVKALGATEVRGIPEPVEMYQVLGFKSAEDSTESPRE
jgi:adenylate cyclase